MEKVVEDLHFEFGIGSEGVERRIRGHAGQQHRRSAWTTTLSHPQHATGQPRRRAVKEFQGVNLSLILQSGMDRTAVKSDLLVDALVRSAGACHEPEVAFVRRVRIIQGAGLPRKGEAEVGVPQDNGRVIRK